MELDELKTLWQSQSGTKTAEPEFTDKNLHQLLSHKAGDIVSRLQRSVVFEYYFTLALLVVSASVLAVSKPEEIKAAAAIMLTISVMFVFVYRKQLQLLKSVSLQNNNVKSQLQLLLKKFNSYLRIYRLSYRALLPVALIIGLILGGQLTTGDNWCKVFSSPLLAAVIVFVLGSYVIAVDFGIAWYLKKLYGNYLTRLEELIKQLNEE